MEVSKNTTFSTHVQNDEEELAGMPNPALNFSSGVEKTYLLLSSDLEKW